MRRRLTIATAEDHIPDDVEELPPLDDGWRAYYLPYLLTSACRGGFQINFKLETDLKAFKAWF